MLVYTYPLNQRLGVPIITRLLNSKGAQYSTIFAGRKRTKVTVCARCPIITRSLNSQGAQYSTIFAMNISCVYDKTFSHISRCDNDFHMPHAVANRVILKKSTDPIDHKIHSRLPRARRSG